MPTLAQVHRHIFHRPPFRPPLSLLVCYGLLGQAIIVLLSPFEKRVCENTSIFQIPTGANAGSKRNPPHYTPQLSSTRCIQSERMSSIEEDDLCSKECGRMVHDWLEGMIQTVGWSLQRGTEDAILDKRKTLHWNWPILNSD